MFTYISPGFYNLTATKLRYWPDSDPITVNADILICQKGDLNTNGGPADAGDLAMMEDAKTAGTSDVTYDLDGDGNLADEDDLAMLKNVSVGVAVLE